MTQEDISRLDHPNHYKKRESPMNAWLNVIYKMMADGCSNDEYSVAAKPSVRKNGNHLSG